MVEGLLAKLTIIPFEDSKTVQAGPPAGPPFVAQFNPETLTITNEFEFDEKEPAHGDTGKEAKFKHLKPRSFTFDFLLDGTGASGQGREVLAQLTLFQETVGFSGTIHRPKFLLLNWGPFLVTCVLETFAVTYKLFRPDGTPLRATLSATFKEHKDKALNVLEKNLSSPDVTHAHLVKAGEHLSLIAHRIYKDPRYYFHIAETNGLNNLRSLPTGMTLYLPPLE